MTIDHLMIDSLMTWARALNGGKPVMLQIGPSTHNPTTIVCDAYTRDVNGASIAEFIQPFGRNVIGKL